MGIMKRLYSDAALRRQYGRYFGVGPIKKSKKASSVKKVKPAKVKLKFKKKKGTASVVEKQCQ